MRSSATPQGQNLGLDFQKFHSVAVRDVDFFRAVMEVF